MDNNRSKRDGSTASVGANQEIIEEFEDLFGEIIAHLRNAPIPLKPQEVQRVYREILRFMSIQFKVIVASVSYSHVELNHWNTSRQTEAKELFLKAMLESGLCSKYWIDPRCKEHKSHP